MYRQLLRVFAHIYHVHFATILHLSLEAHWNALFAHFLAFGREFDILDLRDLRSRDPACVPSFVWPAHLRGAKLTPQDRLARGPSGTSSASPTCTSAGAR